MIDRHFATISWIWIASTALSLFAFEGALAMPLLLIYALLNVLRYRQACASVLRRTTPKQKGGLLLSFAAAVASAFVLVWYGGRLLQGLGAGEAVLYVWIAIVIFGCVFLLRAALLRFRLFHGMENGSR
ncbi:hypothetical protein CDO73_13410 [Saccharibacillus sp. O23]|uniref:hypothetical protein n=1 Tax=Saccharibacillus sp. O23 TaxID=2009338 RepID=UPI000B4E6A80|nr:hypothetical protein [Saccharibacillus sp. O23]OWR30064.1 hypothetical protein CDO73_13410 [Saccharibacillus sp. O23]